MKSNKFILFYAKLILMFSLVRISGNNYLRGIKNLESNIDDKRTLQQSNNYIIIQYTERVVYENNFLTDFRDFIEYIKIEDSIINDTSKEFIIEVNTTLEVYFKENIRSLKQFFGADDFSKIITADLSHFNTSLVTDMQYMFRGCSSLQNLILSNFDTSSVTDMQYMFYECKSLQNLDLSHFNTSLVTDMQYMFYGCSSLQKLNLSHFNTSSVNNMFSMFEGCSSLQNLILSNFNTSSVTEMAYMFYECLSLQNLDLSNFYTSSVNSMYAMFRGCSSLQNLILSNFDTSSVTEMNYMFYECHSLQNLDLSNFNTSSVEFFGDMFYNCTSLKYLIISNFDFSRVETINNDNIFTKLNNLEYIDIYNIKDSNDFLKNKINELNNKNNLIVCQNNDSSIITNLNASYQCCKIISNILYCNNIQTTILQIETTILQIESTIPQLKTTVPQIETTIARLKTTILQIMTTIPQLETTIPQIETTILQLQTTIPQIINSGTSLIVMGFNNFKLSSSNMSFYTHFVPIINNIYSTLMKVNLTINYNEIIRILEEEEKEVECNLKETNNKDIISYFCETGIKNSNIKQVKISPNFNFVYQNNVTIIGSTTIAKMYMNNLQDIDDTYNNLQNSTIYILDHSIYNKYSSNLYNITGIIIQKPKSNLENKKINLMFNLYSESQIEAESICTIIKINENNYTLNCELNRNINVDLQSAISFINDEEILLVNFDNGYNSIITNNPSRRYISKNSNGLKPGAIIAIILPLVFALITTIGVAIYMKKEKITNENKTEIGTESIIKILK